jgi:hypothetical protein
MKKVKIVLNVTAITLAIAGALATRFCMQPENHPQYVPANGGYMPAGQYGVEYNCYESTDDCTFYQPDSVNRPTEFESYRKGRYVPVSK